MNVDKLRTFIANSGAELLEPTNPYEAVRFRCSEGIGVVYTGKRGLKFTGAALTALQFYTRGKIWRASKKYEAWEKPEAVEFLLERDGPLCFFCGKEMGDDVTIEHLLAITHGGSNNYANLCLTHEQCNKDAGHLPLVEKITMHFERRGR